MKDEQVRWVLDTLHLVLRLLGVTNREIESKLGWSHGYLSRLFAGSIELRLEHILVLAEAAGLTPAEFFHLTYPTLPEPLSPSAVRLYQLLRRFQLGGLSTPCRPSQSCGRRAADCGGRTLAAFQAAVMDLLSTQGIGLRLSPGLGSAGPLGR